MTVRVTAVIPTTGRPELRRAVESVRAQTVPCRTVVVNDRPELSGQIEVMLNGLTYELVETEGATGGAAARQRGVEAAHTDAVAFLDDDDAWHARKAERQLAALDAHGDAVITCLTEFREAGGGVRVLPERPYDGTTPVVDYLWERSTLRLRRRLSPDEFADDPARHVAAGAVERVARAASGLGPPHPPRCRRSAHPHRARGSGERVPGVAGIHLSCRRLGAVAGVGRCRGCHGVAAGPRRFCRVHRVAVGAAGA
ncbi:glycosyltransferase family 2 protein [Demequina litorisediminis]|uniref:glycosyltransferase family 2 protein n=1 Tax=Demequina litorisediminis TaxID=1849022 RepID=UPI0024E09AD7|nr:glycosyltransferase family 2 protein [Demequina litorisediminis]